MKFMKKLTAVLTAAALTLGLAPITALAQDEGYEITYEGESHSIENEPSVEGVYSYEDGILEIMADGVTLSGGSETAGSGLRILLTEDCKNITLDNFKTVGLYDEPSGNMLSLDDYEVRDIVASDLPDEIGLVACGDVTITLKGENIIHCEDESESGGFPWLIYGVGEVIIKGNGSLKTDGIISGNPYSSDNETNIEIRGGSIKVEKYGIIAIAGSVEISGASNVESTGKAGIGAKDTVEITGNAAVKITCEGDGISADNKILIGENANVEITCEYDGIFTEDTVEIKGKAVVEIECEGDGIYAYNKILISENAKAIMTGCFNAVGSDDVVEINGRAAVEITCDGTGISADNNILIGGDANVVMTCGNGGIGSYGTVEINGMAVVEIETDGEGAEVDNILIGKDANVVMTCGKDGIYADDTVEISGRADVKIDCDSAGIYASNKIAIGEYANVVINCADAGIISADAAKINGKAVINITTESMGIMALNSISFRDAVNVDIKCNKNPEDDYSSLVGIFALNISFDLNKKGAYVSIVADEGDDSAAVMAVYSDYDGIKKGEITFADCDKITYPVNGVVGDYVFEDIDEDIEVRTILEGENKPATKVRIVCQKEEEKETPSSKPRHVYDLEEISGGVYSKDIEEPEYVFIDVSPTHEYYDEIMSAYRNGYMIGVSDNVFAPDGTLTRGMAATILWNMAGKPEPLGVAPFLDVTADAWYAEAVAWAYEQGIILGYDEAATAFGPNDFVTVEQFEIMISKFNN